jgi:hypothetical protein
VKPVLVPLPSTPFESKIWIDVESGAKAGNYILYVILRSRNKIHEKRLKGLPFQSSKWTGLGQRKSVYKASRALSVQATVWFLKLFQFSLARARKAVTLGDLFNKNIIFLNIVLFSIVTKIN